MNSYTVQHKDGYGRIIREALSARVGLPGRVDQAPPLYVQ